VEALNEAGNLISETPEQPEITVLDEGSWVERDNPGWNNKVRRAGVRR